jgi:hypothetical protein
VARSSLDKKTDFRFFCAKMMFKSLKMGRIEGKDVRD